MKIKKVKGSNKTTCKLSLVGDMTIYTAEVIHEELKSKLETFNNFELTLDKVEEIDSTGLQFLLAIKRHTEQKSGSLTLIKPSEPVTDLFELFNVLERFDLDAA